VTSSGSLSLLEFVWNLVPSFPPLDVCGAIGQAFHQGHADVAEFLISKIEPMIIRLHIMEILRAGASQGSSDIGRLLMPFMNELEDISEIILAGTKARNIELVRVFMEWQREHNWEVSLDKVLIWAIRSGDLEIARLVGKPREDLISEIVEIAIDTGFLEALQYVFGLMSPSERLQLVQRSITRAVRSPNRDVVALFLEMNVGWCESLIIAIKFGYLEMAGDILGRNPRADFVNRVTSEGTPLGVAARCGDLGLVNLLLSVPGIDAWIPDLHGDSPFVIACRHGHVEMYERLAEFSGEDFADHVYEINAGFFCASQRKEIHASLELMPFFSRFSGLDPNFHFLSSSAFIVAAASGHESLLEILLGIPDIEVNDRTSDGSTALMKACECLKVGCVRRLLVDPRVDLDARNEYGLSVLSIAAATGSADLVTLVLGSPRLNLPSCSGEALAVALSFPRQSDASRNIIDIILNYPGIDVNGEIPFSFASSPWFSGRPVRLGTFLDLDEMLIQAPWTPLLMSVASGWVGFCNQIVNHPSFDPDRSHAGAAVFQALASCHGSTFAFLLGNNLTQRSYKGESLLAVALLHGDIHFLELLRQHPGFDMSAQNPAQCIGSVARRGTKGGFEFLANFPDVDLNSPITHASNCFPDLRRLPDSSREDCPSWGYGVVEDLPSHASEGVPPLFALHAISISQSSILADPRIDLNQRGKHGETILFQLVQERGSAGWLKGTVRLDLNAVDRHRNTVLGCAIISRDRTLSTPAAVCDLGMRNENGDTAWELANNRAKRPQLATGHGSLGRRPFGCRFYH
jgi:ankyrin repeat protein